MGRRGCPVIGVAGGIGAGKSTISGIFKRLGAVIIDADAIAHHVLESPETAAEIEREFGPAVLEGSKVSRRALSDVVFSDRGELDKINAIIHPAVIAECNRIMEKSRKDPRCRAVVVDAPLLFETGLDRLCDVVVFVEAAEPVRLERLAASRGWDRQELKRREKFQDSLISKRKRADYIIDNNGSLEDTARQAGEIWKAVVRS